MLRLQADDPAVLARTLRALEASAGARPVALRCSECGTVLARVGTTTHGPLFTSSWPVEVPSPWMGGWVRAADGAPLSRRHVLAMERAATTDRSGAEWTGVERHGVIALLALPPALAQDYPDLLVRCPRHGAAVLERHDVLDWMHAGRTRNLRVSFPLPEYRRSPELPGAKETHCSATVTPGERGATLPPYTTIVGQRAPRGA